MRLGLLTTLVIGSMIGSGVFSLPQNMASGAGAAAVLIGWLMTGVGVLMLAFVYQTLTTRKPDLDNGIGIGIEGANVYPARAQRREDIGRATMLGFAVGAQFSGRFFFAPIGT